MTQVDDGVTTSASSNGREGVDESALGETPSRDSSVMKARILLLSVAVVVVVIDQVTKKWALGALQPGVPRRVAPGLNFTLSFNSGSAFSLGSGGGPIIGVLAVVIVVGVVVVGRKQTRFVPVLVQGLVIGGAIGNLADRALRSTDGFLGGHVVDFLQLPHWPVFNVADMAITMGALTIAILSGTGKFGWAAT